MHDIFYEQILPVKLNFTKQILRILIMGITVLLFIFLLLIGGFLSVTICVLLIYLVFFVLLPKFKLEYEYSLTNNYLNIAAIYNKESRKEKYSLNLHSAEIIAPVDSPRLQYYTNAKIFSFASDDSKIQPFSIIIKNDQTLHNVIIQPNDIMKEHIKRRVPSRMYLD